MSSVRTRAAACVTLALTAAASCLAATPLRAQYFGRTKVQYETFDFRVLHAPHFDVHFYPEEAEVSADATRMAERWYLRHSTTLNHTFGKKPLILYANQPDFQQTNVIGGQLTEETGGVTEAARDRVILPFTGVYADNDHVIGHELVHVFQYDIAALGRGGIARTGALPLWLIEGMAEYLSLGRNDPLTAMWLRDAALRKKLPTIRQLTTDPRFFPYRYGQALWAYVGGRWGDRAIGDVYRAALDLGWNQALRRVLGVSSDSLSKLWIAQIKADYLPLVAGRSLPRDVGEHVVVQQTRRGGDLNISPVLSPDGRYVAFFSSRNLFGVSLFIADAHTGRIIRELSAPTTNTHVDAISFIYSAGTWSPDGSRIATIVYAQGNNEVVIVNTRTGRIERRFRPAGVSAMTTLAWAPDGARLAIAGGRGGVSDLYLYDLATGRTEQLTNDRYADMQPAWSPDGRTIAFATDRGPGTDFDNLTYARLRIGLFDVASRQIRILPLFEGAKHINPQFSSDGRDLFFVSDREGFADIYRYTLSTNQVTQVTRVATGVSGITALSPAISVAQGTGRLIFSVFEAQGYSLYAREAAAATGTPVAMPSVAAVSPDSANVGAGGGGVVQGPPAAPESAAVAQVPAPQSAPAVAAPPQQHDTSLASLARQRAIPGPPTTGAQSAAPAGLLPPIAIGDTGYVATYLRNPDEGLPPRGQSFAVTPYHPRLSIEQVGQPTAGVAAGGFGGTQFLGGISALFSDMLENHVVLAAIQASGTVQDIGAQVLYVNQRRRWNFISSGAHVPYLTGFAYGRIVPVTIGDQTFTGQELTQVLRRVFVDQLSVGAQYPFSTTRRFETSLSANHYGFSTQIQRVVAIGGGIVDEVQKDTASPPGFTFGQASFAFVGDNSFAAFTSPVAGWRYRFEASPSFGQVHFFGALADMRRYFFARPFTLAFRGLHYGRYGKGGESDVLSPLYLGDPTLVRGYQAEDISASECTGASTFEECPQLNRLIGSRVAVANVELRFPLFGVPGFGLLNVPFLPVELAPFADIGVAWLGNERPTLTLARNSTARTPVASAGVTSRINLFGYAIVEIYGAYPFQRPDAGWQIGFQLVPGW